MSKYNSYHSQVKICYSLGLEKELLPKTFIPLSEVSQLRSFYFPKTQGKTRGYLAARYCAALYPHASERQD